MLVRILPLVVAAACSIATAHAQTPIRAQLLGGGFTRPVAVVFDPVVPGAVHLVQQGGLVLTFHNGGFRPTPFLDLRDVVSGGDDERGLLGLAFPPDAATSGRVFVNFTNRTGAGNTVIARFTRSAADPLVVNPASRFDLQFPDGSGGRQGFIVQDFSNHNGGHLAFGPDGYLYIGLGDGGAGDDPNNRAQSPTSLLGKMLRIDVAGSPVNGYTVPGDNPDFTMKGVADALPEIWSFGLRNPWRYSFDDVGAGATGALVIGDVGQGAREEIDYEPAGRGGLNYGWSTFEGTATNGNSAATPAFQPVTAPTFEYTHAVGQVITGGYVYRGAALGAFYQGRYFYSDCAVGRIWSVALTVGAMGDAVASDNRDHTAELGGPFNCVASFARDSAGELYFMDFDVTTSAAGTGRVFKIVAAPNLPPPAPTNLAATVQGSSVTITWNGAAGATSYVLEAGNAPGASNVGTFLTAGTGLAAAGVPAGGYYVRVRGRNANGTGAASAELPIAVGCTFPAAPDTFTGSASGQTVTLGWSVAAGVTQTIVEAGVTPGFTTPIVTIGFAAPQAGVAFPGVPPGTYVARVRAVNACGQSTPSVEQTIVVP
ncbi:MAG: PQQ-dependent sugar dehydrogenase [Vicinamibacterales bacterium]